MSNLEHYSGRNVGAVMFQVRQQKSKALEQAVFRKTTSDDPPTRVRMHGSTSFPVDIVKLVPIALGGTSPLTQYATYITVAS